MSDYPRRRIWRESSAAQVRHWGDSDWTGGDRWRHYNTVWRTHDAATPLADVKLPYEPQPVEDPRPIPEPLRPQAELALTVATDDGSAIADAQLEVLETGEILTTDAAGACLTPIREGSYEIRFAERPKLPVLGEGPGPRTVLLECTRTEPFTLSTGGARHVVVRRPRCTEILVDGYALGSKVLRWGGTRQRLEAGPDGPLPVVGTTRAALAVALVAARGHYVVVVGHADPEGSDQSNAEVALQRSRSTFLYASGQFGLWSSHAAASASELDFSCAMIACSKILGETQDVSEIPALDDPASIRRASAALRRWGGDASAGPSPSPKGTPDDWRLVAEAYELDLSRLLGVDTVDLQRIREAATWVGPGHGALGERFPRPRTEIDVASQVGVPYAVAQRRSAIVIMTRLDAEVLVHDDVLEPLYDGTWRRTTLETPAEVPVVLRCVDVAGKALPHARVWLGGPLGVAAHVCDAAGAVTFLAVRGTRFDVALARGADDTGSLVRLDPVRP
jgi:hypothetical protein